MTKQLKETDENSSSVGSLVSYTPTPCNNVQLLPGNPASVWRCLSGVQHPSWLLQLSVALLLHVVCLLQEPLSLLVTDIQLQRHLLENAVHSNLQHREKAAQSQPQGKCCHILWRDGLLLHLLKVKLFEHADTGYIFLTNLSLKLGDPEFSHSCRRNQRERHFYYMPHL